MCRGMIFGYLWVKAELLLFLSHVPICLPEIRVPGKPAVSIFAIIVKVISSIKKQRSSKPLPLSDLCNLCPPRKSNHNKGLFADKASTSAFRPGQAMTYKKAYNLPRVRCA